MQSVIKWNVYFEKLNYTTAYKYAQQSVDSSYNFDQQEILNYVEVH